MLDICAAPGSKASVLLEAVFNNTINHGCIIANDAERKRIQLMIQKVHKSGTVNLAIINHLGQFLPDVINQNKKLLYDKILCDAPCSGDGHIRNMPSKASAWNLKDGMIRHSLQLALLMKSLSLLKKGGILVYSVSSTNPIENEAVISGLFSKVSTGLEILNVHQMIPIKAHPGMLNWSVCAMSRHRDKNCISSIFQKKMTI